MTKTIRIVLADDHTLVGAGGGQADQVDRGDVRGEHRRADSEPAERLARQKVLLRRGVPAKAGGDADQTAITTKSMVFRCIPLRPFPSGNEL